jgi:bifunctional non-homologous end joining protein LigD
MDEGQAEARGRVSDRRLATGRDRFCVLVGQPQGRALHFLGTVEMGYSRASVALLTEQAAPLTCSSSPFVDLPSRRGVTWLAPRLKAEVTFAEIVAGRLRAVVWRGLATR